MSLSKYLCQGNFVADPELKYTPKGTAVTKFKLAINGSKKGDVYFANFEAWGETAERICQYFKKGRPVIVSDSRPKTDSWEKEGQKHYRDVYVVFGFEFCDSKGKETNEPKKDEPVAASVTNDFPASDEDSPF